MSVVHAGTSKKFAAGWEAIFGGEIEAPAKKTSKKPAAKKTAAKKTAKKTTAKKAAPKKKAKKK